MWSCPIRISAAVGNLTRTNNGREDRKWRTWKEAKEKILRECGVDEVVIE